MMQKNLSRLEIILKQVKYLSNDEKVVLAKHLAMEQGVRMYTPGDVEIIVQRELAKRLENSPILRVGH